MKIFDYMKLKKEIGIREISDFNELFTAIDEYKQIKKDFNEYKINKDNEVQLMTLRFKEQLENQKLDSHRRIKELETTNENTVITLEHSLKLSKELFEAEKEKKRAAVSKEIMQERKEFLNENYGDLKDIRNTESKRELEFLDILKSVVPEYRNNREEGNPNPNKIVIEQK